MLPSALSTDTPASAPPVALVIGAQVIGAHRIGIAAAVDQHGEGLTGSEVIIPVGGIGIGRHIFEDEAAVEFINEDTALGLSQSSNLRARRAE